MKKVETVVYPTNEPTEDKVYRIAECVASLVPAGSNILNALLTAPYERRLEKWCNEVTEAVNILVTKQGISLDDIKSNEQFIDFILSLTQTAVKTSQHEKLKYLKNALVKSATVQFDDQDEYNYYLALIDSFSLAHIIVLIAYRGVQAGCKDEYSRLEHIDNYEHKSYIYRQVLSELISKELVIVRQCETWGIQVYLSPVGNKLDQLLSH
ncbi:hypothetical protein ABF107_004550 [Vibrio parahaemolyticus]|uniref:hypothetical protein n=1 Tax=Vibrio harveyi group TaxID=717610 RepID=UPI0005F2165A|nr:MULTISPECIES: hypothetical protein [Vibrio harveyi group]MCS0395725.1 hypothetical protein [Vibrio diabolicus]HAS6475780.1 hypothetical protein [Vibrio parahaemolyticus]HAS6943319.1 hypothetical protein [Vibrio parahaemolyticus]